MTGGSIAILITIFVLTDAVVVGAVVAMIRAALAPLNSAFPAQPVAPGAVHKRYQSFSFDLCNFGLAIHVAADEHHLHLQPEWFVRWVGLQPISIPWSAITLQRRGTRWRSAKATAAGVSISGPDWCLGLAAPTL